MTARIESIDAYPLQVSLQRPLNIGAMQITHREYVVVEVISEGVTGRFFGYARNAPVAQTVFSCISPHLQGQLLSDYPQRYDQIVQSNVCLGTNGIFWRALSLVDCAMHDLMAKQAGKPLCENLGGELRPTSCMLVGGYPGPDENSESLQAQMQLFVQRGAAAVKLASCSDLARDTRRLQACRETLPAELPLMMDFFWSQPSPEPLIREATAWRELNVGWVEDPFAFDDYTSMAAFQNAELVPLAVGDEQSGDRAFGRLMDEGRVNVVRLDATVCGGVTAFCRISQTAAERGLDVAPHVFHPLHAHLAGAVSNIRCLEAMLPETGIDAVHQLWSEDFEWQDDGFVPPNRPGLGIDWDEDALKRYRIPIS